MPRSVRFAAFAETACIRWLQGDKIMIFAYIARYPYCSCHDVRLMTKFFRFNSQVNTTGDIYSGRKRDIIIPLYSDSFMPSILLRVDLGEVSPVVFYDEVCSLLRDSVCRCHDVTAHMAWED